MQTLKRAAAAAFAMTALITALILPGSPAQANSTAKLLSATHAPAATIHGCPSGYFCIYPGQSWNNDRPSHKFYTYGAHNLSNQFGWKWVLNNQTGGADGWACYQYNGGDCRIKVEAGEAWTIYFDPVNSIKLTP
jgi:hypothetical protein